MLHIIKLLIDLCYARCCCIAWLGKGCSAVLIRPDYVSKKTSVLIPARVVQALQLHFDKTAALSQSNPPLNANGTIFIFFYY